MPQAPPLAPISTCIQTWHAIWPTVGEMLVNANTPSYFEVSNIAGVWTVSKDSAPIERHSNRAAAVLSVRDAMQVIFERGAAASWRLLREA
ncbi:hypothetical protein [Asticcacaulis excentricus]|uniref:Uncharacterized protein n=1 Tax=Asticcacaulis excentricus (strain ATCC 15261 / DSM 4724 / KCTC 12464 / NCIMB 9791 / VKM B-1370 / CB 48) TaxID=573065 RepID=E8RS48_ASTEC|nr:hypothetical protein [Asticcacaulis excentricus]ADU14319.1 hypothetical protein Astex_2677 [Asticcacaulis excentricus CB 48]